MRVVHYLNQFFAGIGGEERAAEPPGQIAGPVGPGTALRRLLEGEAEIVATVCCGDNYLAEWGEQAVGRVVELIAAQQPDVVVAGPAFASGRYGLACGQVARALREKLGVGVVSGMHAGNPGLDLCRRWAYVVPTRESALGMADALARMATLVGKLGRGEELGPAEEEGYFPTGRRLNRVQPERGAARAAAILRRRLRGEDFRTEWELPRYDAVTPAPPLRDVRTATLALASESGCVPRGNPDGLRSGWATLWAAYDLAGLDRLPAGDYQFNHGGYDTTFVAADPQRALPLDALRQLQREGAFARLHEEFLTTCGNMAALSQARAFGREMAERLRGADVEGVILTAT